MEIYDDTMEYIDIAALDIALLSSEQKEAIIQDAKIDEEYIQLCKTLTKGENIDSSYAIQEHVLVGKGRIDVPKAMWKKVLKSEHDLKVAGCSGRELTIKQISRNCFWPKWEDDVQQYCNECDNSQSPKAPRHAKYRLLHHLESPCKPWKHISTDFITDLSESSGFTKILVVVDRFTQMAHSIPILKKDSPSVAWCYWGTTPIQ